MKLVSGIVDSGFFAQSALSAEVATKDSLGRNISETYLTGVDLTPYQTIEGMTAYQSAGDYQPSGEYYSASNPSGFITGVDLSDYATTAEVADKQDITGMTAYQPVGDYLTAVPESALSGFIPYSASGIELPNSNFKIDVSGQAYKVSSYNETETITGNYGGDYETWFPLSSLERRVYSSTLPPGDFDCGSFMVYPNHGGNEYYIPLNGIVDLTLIPQENWDTSTILSINATNNVEAILSYSDTNNVEIPYLTAVPDTYLQNTDLSTEDGKVTAISGIPLSAGGSDVPEGVMVESGLEYNAVQEISGYNGSAIAQYGAEKQWLVHDDTLVHAANSAQYALGVNVSAVQSLMGLDETVLFSSDGTQLTAFTASEPLTNFNEVVFYVSPTTGLPAAKVSIPMVGYNTSGLALTYHTIWAGFKGGIQFSLQYNHDNMSAFTCAVGEWVGWASTGVSTGTSKQVSLYKIIGIGRKQ